jgi:succinoglycan biosynthesis transport protein ExoP
MDEQAAVRRPPVDETGAAAPGRGRGGAIRLIRVRLVWILAVTAVVAGSTALFTLSQQPVYKSTARVVVLPEVRTGVPAPPLPSMGTEKELVTSELVTSRAASVLGVPIADLTAGTEVTVPVDTEVLDITCSSGDPGEAQRRAQALADAYVTYKATQPIPTLPEQARVMTPAGRPGSPSQPKLPLNLAAGLLVGLLLGFLTALVRDRLDGRVRGAGELEQRGLPVLAVLPPSRELAPAPDVLVLRAPESAAAQAYGALGEQILVATRDASPATVVVAGAVPELGTSSVAANLAATLALSGRQVVIVDADSRPARTDPAGLRDRPGLLDVLAHQVPLQVALQRTRVPRLTLLSLGHRTPASPPQLVGSRWAQTSAALAKSFEIVIVAAAPLLTSANGVRVAHGATGVVLVVHDRQSARADLDRAVVELLRVEAPVLGCVLIQPPHRWNLLPRPLRRLRRGSALQRRLDHPEDYARELAPEATYPGTDQSPSAEPAVGTAATVPAEPSTGRPTAGSGGSPPAGRDLRSGVDGVPAGVRTADPEGAPRPPGEEPRAAQNGKGRLDPDTLHEEASG